MGALEVLVLDILKATGLQELSIKTRLGLELPGYYHAGNKWDLLVVAKQQLVCAIEFKSQAWPILRQQLQQPHRRTPSPKKQFSRLAAQRWHFQVRPGLHRPSRKGARHRH